MSQNNNIPNDLRILFIFACITLIYIIVPHLSTTWVRTWLELAMVSFFPGYALVYALFPAHKYPGRIVRIVLGFILSYGIVFLFELAFIYIQWKTSSLPILITVFTLLTCMIAIIRSNTLFVSKIRKAYLIPIVQSSAKVSWKGKSIPRIQTDLLLIIVFIVLTAIVLMVPSLANHWIRTVIGLPVVLIFPGYTLIVALFPRKDDLEGIERLVLSFGFNIAVVPLLGLGLNYTPWGIRFVPIFIALSVYTLSMCAIILYRRSLLLEEEIFTLPFATSFHSIHRNLFEQEQSGLYRIVAIILIITVLSSLVMLVYGIVTPKQSEKFTEFYILGSDGMAHGYPTNFTLGDNGTVIVGIVNHEYATIKYSLALVLANRSTTLYTDIVLDHDETWEQPVTFTPDSVGTEMKLHFLLYNNIEPEPYRDLYLWIDVSDAIYDREELENKTN